MLEAAVTSSVLVLAVLLVRVVFRERTGLRVRYALWAMVALRLLLPFPMVSSPLSVMNAVEAAQESFAGEEGKLSGIPDDAAQAEGASVRNEGAGTKRNSGGNETGKLLREAGPEAPMGAGGSFAIPVTGWKLVWILGILVTAGCVAGSNLRLWRRLKRQRVRVEMHGFPLPVYRAEGLSSPCLYGLFRPAVYLTPESFGSETRLRHILTHEYTHFCHGDMVWALVRSLCICCYWFDPLVWLAAALSKKDCELACDEGTLKRLGEGERLAYGRTLLELVSGSLRERFLCSATSMTAAGKSFRQRLKLVVKKPGQAVPALCAALVLLFAAAGCAFTGVAEYSESGPSSSDGTAVSKAESSVQAGSETSSGTKAEADSDSLSPLSAEEVQAMTKDVFQRPGDPKFILTMEDGSEFSYIIEDWYQGRLSEAVFPGGTWTRFLGLLDRAKSDYCLCIVSGDSTKTIRMYGMSGAYMLNEQGAADYVEVETDGETAIWKVETIFEDGVSPGFVPMVRAEFDMGIPKVSEGVKEREGEGTREQRIARDSMESFLQGWNDVLPPDHPDRIRDYKINQMSEEATWYGENKFVISCSYSVLPVNEPEKTLDLMPGNTRIDEGNWLRTNRFLTMENQNGLWYCTARNTGP